MDLILWRHAEAEDSIPDMARALTPKGEEQAQAMAAWLHKRLPADARVVVSPARRTQQTANALAKLSKNKGEDFVTLAAVAPGASARDVMAAAGWPDAGGTVLVVGHQPTLGEVAGLLLAGKGLSFSTKKGAIWWLRQRDHETILRAAISPDML